MKSFYDWIFLLDFLQGYARDGEKEAWWRLLHWGI